MLKRGAYLLICWLLLTTGLHAQQLEVLPEYVVSKGEPSLRTTLYAPLSNELLVFQQGRYWTFSKEGKMTGGPFILRTDGGDIQYPRISESGKKIFFYLRGTDPFALHNRIAVYDRDSGFVMGTDSIHSPNEFRGAYFFGDSSLRYNTHFREYDDLKTWNFSGQMMRTLTFFADTLQRGWYDMGYYEKRITGIYRLADTIGLIISGDNNFYQYFTTIKLSSNIEPMQAQFARGYPYALLNDESTGQLDIYKLVDTSFKQVAKLERSPVIYGAAGTDKNCYVLFRDTTQRAGTALQLFNVAANKKIPINNLPGAIDDYLYTMHPSKGIMTASHLINGTIIAFNLEDGTKAWDSSPQIETNKIAAAKTDSADSKLFKILIKQGTDDITGSYYNKETNQLYLIKNNDKLITVDATAKAAVRWEQFYKDNFTLPTIDLLPGNRYILYREQSWKAGTKGVTVTDFGNLTDENGDQYNHIYPHTIKVYDRNKEKVIFSLQSKEEEFLLVINDSLLYWSRKSYLATDDSVFIYNLNTGATRCLNISKKTGLDAYCINQVDGKIYVLAATERKLILQKENGPLIFARNFPTGYFFSKAHFVDNSSYWYYNDQQKTSGNIIYKIQNDSVKTIRNLPAAAEILAVKATSNNCWFFYKKKIKRKSGELFQYRLFDAVNGRDKLVDSSEDDYALSARFELFPDDNFYTRTDGKLITWHDLGNNFEFNNFGRDEPTIVSIAYSPDGRYLAAANPYQKVLLWDLGTGKETKTLTVGNSGYITKLAFSGDGKYLAASSGDIWEVASGKNVVSVTDGKIWEVNSIDFSNDGKRVVSGGACIISWDAGDGSKMYFQQRPGKDDMDTSGTCWNPNGCLSKNYGLLVHSTAIHPNSRDFVTGNVTGIVQRWNTESKRQQAYVFLGETLKDADITVYDLKYTRDGQSIIALQKDCIYRLDATTLKVQDSLFLPASDEILGIDMGYDGKQFGCITRREKNRIVQIRSIDDLSVQKEFYAEGASFNKISFSPNKKQAATSSEDGFCTIWDLASGKPAMYLSTIGDYGNIMVTPDNYYMASRSALEGVTFFKDSSFYSFDQFDLYLNRPDIVLSRLGYAAPELINFYKTAYYKRLKKTTGNTRDIMVSDYVPGLKLINRKSIPAVTATAKTILSFTITDSAAKKGELGIYINGNPVTHHAFETTAGGISFTDSVLLGQGVNSIETVYRSAAGVESRKEKISVTYSPNAPVQPKTWFIGIGISAYKNAAMNLRYPVKDIKDIARDFKKHYPGLIIDTLLNERATRENILALHDKLMKTGVNDKVIVSFSGHGLLSDSLDWYFATWDIDFKKPEERGLAYTMMEGLLDGIPARQKLLLMDACHSGEVDKESDTTIVNKLTAMQPHVVSGAKGLIGEGTTKTGLQTSFELMQELFANLSNGNGTTVLSAAGGNEYALESDTWKNGVFTYSLLQALKDPATDEDNNKKISIKELKKAVFKMVVDLTGGRQKPTSRLELLDDWNIW